MFLPLTAPSFFAHLMAFGKALALLEASLALGPDAVVFGTAVSACERSAPARWDVALALLAQTQALRLEARVAARRVAGRKAGRGGKAVDGNAPLKGSAFWKLRDFRCFLGGAGFCG